MADFYYDNRRLQDAMMNGEIPPPPPTMQAVGGYLPASDMRYAAQPDIRYMSPDARTPENPAYIEALMSNGLPPEALGRVLMGHGVDPSQIKKILDMQQSVRDYRDAPQVYARRLADASSKTSNTLAESFKDPGRAAASFGVDLRGNTPYSPQRAAQDRAELGSRWEKFEDAEGNMWERDTTGRLPARPLLTAGRQVVKTKELGSGELDALRENAQQVAQVVKALGMMRGETVEGQQGDAEATGFKGYLPDIALQRIDKVGNPTRAQIANVGSLKIKQRSGAAVSASEMARLKPFIPLETDDPEQVRSKLSLFANEYAKMLEEDVGAYTAANRRVPVALKNYVNERIGMARGVMSGRQTASSALSGQADPAIVLKAIQDELARRGGGG